MKLKNIYFIPLVIILFGVIFTLYLQGQIFPEVFFSGDGGLKALLAKQLATGELRFDLITPTASWIHELWNQGLYPYEPPFVYNVENRYFITFPYTFPLVTAPFYAWFGERGLYLIPLLSTWVIWLNFYWICKKIKLKNFSICLGLISLIFSSYLTIYSVMYWEHTLAVALCFSGIGLYVISNYPQRRTNRTAVISGILIGLAVWFRPEFLCMVALLSGMVVFASWQLFIREFADRKFKIKEYASLAAKKEIFIASTIATVGGFFISNKLIYGHALGIHGIQAVEKVALSDRLMSAWLNFTQMALTLPEYLPVILFPILYISLYLISLFIVKKTKIKFNRGLFVVVALASILFIAGVAMLVPVGTAGLIPGGKQWGIRFLLILVPIITLLATIEFSNLAGQLSGWKKYFILVFFIFLIAIGFQKNIVEAKATVERNIQNTLPAIEFLQQDDHQVIAISQHFVGQALEASTKNKLFFKVEDSEQLIALAQALINQQEFNFIYICYPYRACPVPKTKAENLQFTQGDRDYQIKISSLGIFGKYPIYQLTIE